MPVLPALIQVWAPSGQTVVVEGEAVTDRGLFVVVTAQVVNHLLRGTLLNRGPLGEFPTLASGGGVSAQPSLGSLSSSSGETDAAVAFVRSELNGEEGQFCWHVGSAESAVVGMVVEAAGGRWKRLFEGGRRNIRWFGARGDGFADDTDAIYAAVAHAEQHGCSVYLPPGTYRITRTIRIGKGDGNGDREGITLLGANSPGAQNNATTLLWDAPTYAIDQPMFWLNGANYKLENLHFATNGKALRQFIECGPFLHSAPWFNSHDIFKGCSFFGNSLVHYAISVGLNVFYEANKENFVFEDCDFDRLLYAGVVMNSGQAINTVFNRCNFRSFGIGGDERPTGWGIQNNSPSTHLRVRDCDFNFLEVALLMYNYGSVTVEGGQSESCKKFLFCFALSSGVGTSASITNARINTAKSASQSHGPWDGGFGSGYGFGPADVNFIQVNDGRNLYMANNVLILGGEPHPMKLAFDTGSTIICEGNIWPNDDPFSAINPGGLGAPVCGIYSRDKCVTDSLPFGTQCEVMERYYGGLNPSATATISGAATSVAVTLPRTEWDTAYHVRLDVESVTAGGAVGSLWTTSKTATGFTINTSSAPGVGKDLVVRYTTWR